MLTVFRFFFRRFSNAEPLGMVDTTFTCVLTSDHDFQRG